MEKRDATLGWDARLAHCCFSRAAEAELRLDLVMGKAVLLCHLVLARKKIGFNDHNRAHIESMTH